MTSGALKVWAYDDSRGLRIVAVNYSFHADAKWGGRASFGDNRINKVGTKKKSEGTNPATTAYACFNIVALWNL